MIVGRVQEIKKIDSLYQSTNSEFLALYGRRRIGKTYLIRERVKQYKKAIFMHVTGKHKGVLSVQLQLFAQALSETYYRGVSLASPKSWDDAFKTLHEEIERSEQKTIIFLDELPWLNTGKSGLLQAIDHYWNHYWSSNNKVFLIVCGSSAAWMIKNIIHDKGGLHNRITEEIRLLPFDLAETKQYLIYKGIKLNDKHIVKIYMAIGGVPYYLNHIKKGLTADQAIQQILFRDGAPLKLEFKKLFASLFRNASAYQELVKILSKKKEGLTRAEIQAAATQSSNGGQLTDRLKELCAAGFLQAYMPWGKNNGEYFKLIDEYCLFYLSWIKQEGAIFTENHWQSIADSPSYYAWAGYSFEAICWKHINKIVKALDLPSGGLVSSWQTKAGKGGKPGAQIDLLIDRNDDAITLCEIKFSDSIFVIDKSYAQALQRKVDTFKEVTKTSKQVFLVMISSQGVKENKYSTLMLDGVVTLKDVLS